MRFARAFLPSRNGEPDVMMCDQDCGSPAMPSVSRFATEVCLLMQDRTGINPPLHEWNKVGTVREIIELLVKSSVTET